MQQKTSSISVEQQNANMRERALRAALYALGIGATVGGGARLAKEIAEPLFTDEPDFGDREIAIDITNPAARRRTKRADPEQPMTSPLEWTPSIPLMVAGAGAGLYGGNVLMRRLVEGVKRRRAESALAEAQQEFEDTLRSQYRNKRAALEDALDAGYEQFEKSAEAGVWDYTKGIGLSGMAALWLLTHKSFLDAAKKTDPEALQMKILERQRRLRQTMSPPPVVFDVAPGDEAEFAKLSADETEDEDEDDEPEKTPQEELAYLLEL
jgi:hypothetical protein